MDIFVLLYYKYLNIDPKRPDWRQDRFILSKGIRAWGTRLCWQTGDISTRSC
jgi:transketolase N-terminal domain/subunit